MTTIGSERCRRDIGLFMASVAGLPHPMHGAVMWDIHSAWCWWVMTEMTSMKAVVKSLEDCWEESGCVRKVGTGCVWSMRMGSEGGRVDWMVKRKRAGTVSAIVGECDR